jgi:ribulose-bisphosphate carboxylase large chain
MSGWFRVEYLVASRDADIEGRARALALEQSVELPLEGVRDSRVRDRVVARVEGISAVDAGRFRVTVAMALDTTGLEAGQLVNMLFGNCALQPEVELLDFQVPRPLARALGGPRFGIAGMREATGVHGRALTCCALKPLGLAPAELARLAGLLARGGVDVIKDDHGIADQGYAPFARRVVEVQRAIERANGETGGRTVYAPTLGGSPKALAEQVRILSAEGVAMALACPAIVGVPCFRELARELLPGPVLAHPAFAGGRVAPALLLGKLFRLLGADATIFPSYGGRFPFSEQQCREIAEAARAPLHDVAATMPVPAGGMRVESVAAKLAFYGMDTMLLIGGNVLAADDVEARAREFTSAVRATCARASGRDAPGARPSACGSREG